jgi:hypothetical protein
MSDKQKNVEYQNKFRKANPYYNAYQSYKKRLLKAGEDILDILTYEEFVNAREREKNNDRSK